MNFGIFIFMRIILSMIQTFFMAHVSNTRYKDFSFSVLPQ